MGILVLLGIFAVCVLIGTPVAFALGISAIAAFWYEGLPMMIGFQRIVSGINVFALMAIPFFIFAGELMFHGGIAVRLVRFAQAAVGAARGGPWARGCPPTRSARPNVCPLSRASAAASTCPPRLARSAK